MRIAVLTVTYSQKLRDANGLLQSCNELCHQGHHVELFVSRNSRYVMDDEAEGLSCLVKCSFYGSGSNLGYAGGNNILLDIIETRGVPFDLVLICNPDVIIPDGFVIQAKKDFDKYSLIGAIAPVSTSSNSATERQRELSGLNSNRRSLRRFQGRKDSWIMQDESLIETILLTGCCMALRPCLVELGVRFREEFFMYVEELDLCSRLRDYGFTTVIDTRYNVLHNTHLDGISIIQSYYQGRNALGWLLKSPKIGYDYLIFIASHSRQVLHSAFKSGVRNGNPEIVFIYVLALVAGLIDGVKGKGGETFWLSELVRYIEILRDESRGKLLIIVQPKLFNYRREVFQAVDREIETIVVSESSNINIEHIDDELQVVTADLPGKKLLILMYLFLFKPRRSTTVWISCTSKSPFVFFFFLTCAIKRSINVIAHGQCSQRRRVDLVYLMLYGLWYGLSNLYVSYSRRLMRWPYTRHSGELRNRVAIIENRYQSFSSVCLDKEAILEKFDCTWTRGALKIAVIGRRRKSDGYELLLKALCLVKDLGCDIDVDVFGPSDTELEVPEKLMGSVRVRGYQDEKGIFEVCANCDVGIAAGDSGLAVMHYMSLGLAVITHNEKLAHMGPEPAIITDFVNGLTFKRGSHIDLSRKIFLVYNNRPLMKQLAKKGFTDVERLHRELFSVEMYRLLQS